jgi:hypothetical protein
MKQNGRMFIWLDAALMIVSLAPIAIRLAVLYVDAFSRAAVNELDAEWWQRALSSNFWATMRMSIVAMLGSLLLAGGLISKWRARRRITAESAKAGLN